LRDFLQSWYALEVVDDGAHVVAVVNTQLDAAVEDALLGGDGEAVDVHVELRGDDLRDLHEHAHAVDAA